MKKNLKPFKRCDKVVIVGRAMDIVWFGIVWEENILSSC